MKRNLEYLAGIFDACGTCKYSPKHRSYRLEVSSSSIEILNAFTARFGGNITGKDTSTYWYVSGSEAVNAAKQLVKKCSVNKRWLRMWIQGMEHHMDYTRYDFVYLIKEARPIHRAHKKYEELESTQ